MFDPSSINSEPLVERDSLAGEVAAVLDADGVDHSTVRRMLGLSPCERLEYAQGVIDLVGSVSAVTDGNR